ncbi:hypothetical protein [Oceanicoccus sp. KOV_DT_Chl]|uniref:hypothetical protein n=1 Tax=Oceanicoccus sp. KOV_DT_Chl TaxID=1904639 RepID=UPI000C7CC40A|nr:hypothetical protein [Oceanicoccus sp. KOV_DT_Chl]
MSRTDAPLVPTDEGLNHQIIDTFAAVLQADRSWTEKVCLSIGAKDGSVQIGFGLGKYINRNVMDAYAGVSRGVEQWTVRTSRQLAPNPDIYSVGEIHYEIVEPLKTIRVRLEESSEQPIAFDVTMDCSMIPPFLENHEFRRQLGGYRTDNDLVRYHQVGEPTGWIMLEGQRIEITADNWYCSRDHSWGLRYGVGFEPTDIMPGIDASQFPMNFLWSPMRLVKPDGSAYSIHHFYMKVPIPGVPKTFYGGIEYADGTREAFADLEPELSYDPVNRRLQGGKLHFTRQDGGVRTLCIEVISDTGFQLGAGLYFGFDGHYHGEWRGVEHRDGEYFADCSLLENAKRLHQIRDCIVKVTDGDAVGYANYQTVVNGEWPELGLSAEDSFV